MNMSSNLSYTQTGDYLLPNLTLHQPKTPLGKYGRMRLIFLMIRVMVKFKSFPIMIYKTAAAIQKILRMSADAVLFRQCFSAEFAVGLCLVQFDDPLLAILKTGTMLAQFILNFSLRLNKSGGRFFALRLVDGFNLFSFGGNVCIEET